MSFLSILYNKDLRTEAIHLKSKSKIITDAPTDNHGKGQAFSPTDLVAAALATCMITVMGIKANDWNIPLDGATLDVEKIMASNPRRIQQIIIKIVIPNVGLNDKQKETLIRTAMECPVAKSLHPEMIQQVSFDFV